jgi:hypothetical protein
LAGIPSKYHNSDLTMGHEFGQGISLAKMLFSQAIQVKESVLLFSPKKSPAVRRGRLSKHEQISKQATQQSVF